MRQGPEQLRRFHKEPAAAQGLKIRQMAKKDATVFFLSASALDRLGSRRAGKLVPRLDPPAPAAGFAVLDNFDEDLRRSRRLLIRAGGRLELLARDGCDTDQAASRCGNFVADHADGPVKAALDDLPPLRALLPVGTGQMRHAALALVDDQGKTHARAVIRLMEPVAGKATVIVTLTGLRGYDKGLGTLRDHIAACGGLPLARAGLYRRLFPAHRSYDVRPPIRIDRHDRAFDAACTIIASHLRIARANHAGIIADLDSEFLHDYRVALRKIRSVLSLFKGVYDPNQTAMLKDRFAALMTPTGRLRDLDVYLLERRQYYDLLPPALHGGLDRMFLLFEQERRAAHAALARQLAGKAGRTEIASLGRLFDRRGTLRPGPNAGQGAHELACALIWHRYRKIRKIAATIGPDTADSRIHALRIHCKKLRYLMELFAPLFAGPDFSALLKPLKRLQDVLGLFNDFSVQQVSLRHFVNRPDAIPVADRQQIAESVDALIVVLHDRQLKERDRILNSFSRFNSARTQRRFRRLFHRRKEDA